MKQLDLYITEKLKLNKDTKLDSIEEIFEKFKNIVKGILGLQCFPAKDYNIRLAKGNIFTVHFNCSMTERQLQNVFTAIYKELDKLDLNDSDSHIGEKWIEYNKKTLLFYLKINKN